MRFIKKIVAVFLASSLILTALFSSQNKQAVYIGNDREQVNISLQNINIDDFVKMVGKIINKNILIPQSIPGTVNMVSNAPVFKDEVLNILISVLDSKGFTLVEDEGFLKIIRSAQAVQSNLKIVSASKDALMHTALMQPKNIDIDLTAARVRQFSSPSGKIITVKETNSMLVSDFPGNIEVIKELVELMDKDSQTKYEVEFVRLENAVAPKILEDLNKIAKSIINPTVPGNKFEIIKDDGTNSIAIVATAENIKIIKELAQKFDAKNTNITKTKIFPIRNSEAKNTLTTINEILAKKKYTDETTKPMASADVDMNAIIISATEADMRDIAQIIEALDIEKPQVYVKAKIVEVSQSESQKIGLKYGLEGGKANSSGLYSFVMNMGGSSVALSSSLQGAIDIGELKEGLALGAMIDFLAGEGAATILSEPSILCINNQESSIYVGQTESILTSTTQGSSTTDIPRSTYTRQDIGLTLKIKPRLSSGEMVTLGVQATLEDVLGGSGTGLPTTTKRDVKTSAIVNSGESVIIGGLIKNKSSQSVSKLPLLGDIPVMGELFKNHNDTEDKINLVIILTPYIVEKSSDLAKLRETLNELEAMQNRYKTTLIEQIKKEGDSQEYQEQNDRKPVEMPQ